MLLASRRIRGYNPVNDLLNGEGVVAVTVLAFLLVFSIVVFVHELGHFTVAKLSGVRVEEFGFGYPPRLVRVARRGDTDYTINAIPIGGFVRVAGDENPDDPRSLTKKSAWTRAGFLVAGPVMNVVLAVVLFGASYMMGVLQPTVGPGVGIYDVAAGSPAAHAGLQLGDVVLSVDGQPVNSPEALQQMVNAHLDQEIALTVQRNGAQLPQPVRLVPRSEHPADEGAMGVRTGPPLTRAAYPFGQAIILGAERALGTVVMMVGGLAEMVRGQAPLDLAGPIGIAQATGEVIKSGFVQLVEWTAFLSVNLFIINLLPIPALDGGRLVFVALELVRGGRRVDPQKEGLVHLVGIVVLLGLFLIVSYFDVLRLVRGMQFPGP